MLLATPESSPPCLCVCLCLSCTCLNTYFDHVVRRCSVLHSCVVGGVAFVCGWWHTCATPLRYIKYFLRMLVLWMRNSGWDLFGCIACCKHRKITPASRLTYATHRHTNTHISTRKAQCAKKPPQMRSCDSCDLERACRPSGHVIHAISRGYAHGLWEVLVTELHTTLYKSVDITKARLVVWVWRRYMHTRIDAWHTRRKNMLYKLVTQHIAQESIPTPTTDTHLAFLGGALLGLLSN